MTQADRATWACDAAEQVGRLPGPQSTAIRLIYTHGLTFREAAAWIHVEEGEISGLLATALRFLGRSVRASQP